MFYEVLMEKRAARVEDLRRAVSAHSSKMLRFGPQSSARIDDSLEAIKTQMNHLVRSSGGNPSPDVKAEFNELRKMRAKLQRFKSPRVQEFSREAVPDFHGGSWKSWASGKGVGMSTATRDALQRGAHTFGETMEAGIRATGGKRAIIPAGDWNNVTNMLGPKSIVTKVSPRSAEGKSFMSLNASLHEVDEFKNLRRKGLADMAINRNHHVGVDPVVLDMNRALTATGSGADEFRAAVKKQRWDELDFMEKNLPPETARFVSNLKRGERINRHARKKINRDWAAFTKQRGSTHDHVTPFSKRLMAN